MLNPLPHLSMAGCENIASYHDKSAYENGDYTYSDSLFPSLAPVAALL